MALKAVVNCACVHVGRCTVDAIFCVGFGRKSCTCPLLRCPPARRITMPRGVTPRRPAKTGRQEGARVRAEAISKLPKHGRSAPKQLKAGAQKQTPKASNNGRVPARGYNPISPKRV